MYGLRGGMSAGPGGPADFPGWCSYMPFADFMAACRVPTKAEQDAYGRAQIEKAAGAGTPNYNPELAQTQYEDMLRLEENLARLDPEGAAVYQQAGGAPFCSATFGEGAAGRFLCGDGAGPSWGLWIVGGLLAFAVVKGVLK